MWQNQMKDVSTAFKKTCIKAWYLVGHVKWIGVDVVWSFEVNRCLGMNLRGWRNESFDRPARTWEPSTHTQDLGKVSSLSHVNQAIHFQRTKRCVIEEYSFHARVRFTRNWRCFTWRIVTRHSRVTITLKYNWEKDILVARDATASFAYKLKIKDYDPRWELTTTDVLVDDIIVQTGEFSGEKAYPIPIAWSEISGQLVGHGIFLHCAILKLYDILPHVGSDLEAILPFIMRESRAQCNVYSYHNIELPSYRLMVGNVVARMALVSMLLRVELDIVIDVYGVYFVQDPISPRRSTPAREKLDYKTD